MSAYDPLNLDPEKTRPYAVSLSPKVDEELSRFAAKAGITKSKLMTNILSTAVETLDFADNLGFVDLSVFIRDLIARIKDKMRLKKKEGEEFVGAKSISFTLPLKVFLRLEYFAAKADIGAAKLAQNILGMGVEELQSGEKLGFVQTALFIEDFRERFGKSFWRFLGFTKSKEDLERMK